MDKELPSKDGCIYCTGSRFHGFITRVFRETPESDVVYSNIETKYCPNCGKKIIKGNRKIYWV